MRESWPGTSFWATEDGYAQRAVLHTMILEQLKQWLDFVILKEYYLLISRTEYAFQSTIHNYIEHGLALFVTLPIFTPHGMAPLMKQFIQSSKHFDLNRNHGRSLWKILHLDVKVVWMIQHELHRIKLQDNFNQAFRKFQVVEHLSCNFQVERLKLPPCLDRHLRRKREIKSRQFSSQFSCWASSRGNRSELGA